MTPTKILSTRLISIFLGLIVLSSENTFSQCRSILLSEKGNVSLTNSNSKVVVAPQANGVYKTILPDGTKLFVDVNSLVRYSIDADIRIVEVDGQAFFDIKKSKKPFIIKANNLLVKANGCKINIRAFSSDKVFTVSLAGNKGSFTAYDLLDNSSLVVNKGTDDVEVENCDQIRGLQRLEKLKLMSVVNK